MHNPNFSTKRQLLLLLIASCLLASCSNRAIYDSIHRNRQIACLDNPQLVYEECMRQHNLTYAEYERQREEIIQKQESKR